MSFTINSAPAFEPPAESVTLTLDMRQFTALAALAHGALAYGHPLTGLVQEAVLALPEPQRMQVMDMRRDQFGGLARYPNRSFAAEMLG